MLADPKKLLLPVPRSGRARTPKCAKFWHWSKSRMLWSASE